MQQLLSKIIAATFILAFLSCDCRFVSKYDAMISYIVEAGDNLCKASRSEHKLKTLKGRIHGGVPAPSSGI